MSRTRHLTPEIEDLVNFMYDEEAQDEFIAQLNTPQERRRHSCVNSLTPEDRRMMKELSAHLKTHRGPLGYYKRFYHDKEKSPEKSTNQEDHPTPDKRI